MNTDSYVTCAFLALTFIALVAIVVLTRSRQRDRTVEAEQAKERARLEAEEKFQPYPQAWAAARASDNVEALIQCGNYLIKAARLWQPHLVDSVAWDVYKEILERLKKNPSLKPVALEIGRAAYSARRAKGELTVYDEQAIQNDIMAHSE